MQPQKYVAVACEDWPDRLRLGCRQWIGCTVATVIEQHGRKRSAAGGPPHLCTQPQRSGWHVDHVRRGCALARALHQHCGSDDGDTDYADNQNGPRAFHDLWIYHAQEGTTIVTPADPQHGVILGSDFHPLPRLPVELGTTVGA